MNQSGEHSKNNHFIKDKNLEEDVNITSSQPEKRELRPTYQFKSGAIYEGEWIGNYYVNIWKVVLNFLI